MNLKFCKQMDYENKRDWTIGQNKPNQTQFQMPTNPSKERKKKGIRNFFWVSSAGMDIL